MKTLTRNNPAKNSGADGQDVDEKPVSGYESFTLTERLLTPLSRRRLRLNQSPKPKQRRNQNRSRWMKIPPKPKRKKSSPHLHGPTVEKPSHPRQRRIHQ